MVSVISGLPSVAVIGNQEEEELYRLYSGLPSQPQQSRCQSGIYSHRLNAKATVQRCQMKTVHLRSQSMPEDAYIKYNLQRQAIQEHCDNLHQVSNQQTRQEKRMSMAHPATTTNISLKRSHTNVADLAARYSTDRQKFEAPVCYPNTLAARTRSNIAALNWNFGETELHSGRTNLSRTTSFYHRDQIHSARSVNFYAPKFKDLSRPLHVDCSVEYDLGNQPKIPKNSAPLLIIHPAYQQRLVGSMNSPTDLNSLECLSPVGSWQKPSVNSFYSVTQTPLTHFQPNRLDFEVSQSAPPKPQHRITRHSSFLVGGGVMSRQVTRPIMAEEELSYSIHHPYKHPFGNLPEVSSRQNLASGTANAAVRRSRSIHQTLKGFHLSMPDISVNENNRRLQMGLRNNGQHHHPRPSRAKTNLEAKLEAARKFSTESRDSGTSLDLDGLNAMPEDENKFYSMLSTPHQPSQQAFSDSGLGTPSSLMDQEEAVSSSSSVSSGNGSATSSMTKWKSSVTGGSQVVWRAFVSSLRCMHF